MSHSLLKLNWILACALGAAACTAADEDAPASPRAGDRASPIARAGSSAPAPTPELNGCSSDDYQDRSAASADRVIAIAAQGLTYSPKCLTIAAGQTVRWQGSLTAHPLAPGNPEDADAGSPDSPIRATATGSSVEFSFPEPGAYPYFCTLHAFGAGQGMAGVIHVR